MAQLAERSLPILEVRGSNPDTSKNFIEHLFTVNWIVLKRRKENRKVAGNGPFKKRVVDYLSRYEMMH